jgi:hypothetical protein
MTKYAKAAASGLAGGLATLSALWSDGGLSTQDWLAAIVAAIGATGLVWAVPNRKA